MFEKRLSLTKAGQLDLLHLCKVKYQELKDTHLEFMRSLLELLEIIQRVRNYGSKSAGVALQDTDQMDRDRRAGRQFRLRQYVQAKFYAEQIFIDRTYVLRGIPHDVVEAVRETMKWYTAYFSPRARSDSAWRSLSRQYQRTYAKFAYKGIYLVEREHPLAKSSRVLAS